MSRRRAHIVRRGLRTAGRLAASTAHCLALVITGLCWLVVLFELWVRMGSISPATLDGFAESTRLVDERGVLLREVVGEDGARAVWRPLDEMSPLIVEATIAVEDARFYEHQGVDAIGVVRAMRDNLRAGRVVSGASTLTMQLARLLKPSPKTALGKLGEMVRARRIERAVDKHTILEQYLNRAPYGRGVIGVEAASQRHFGKGNMNLSLAEAALIAGLPKAPSRLDPRTNPDAARARQHKVLARMLQTGRISRAEYQQAVAEPLHFQNQATPLSAMHFTDHVLDQLRRQGQARGGAVQTTLDGALQADIEGAVRNHVRSLATGNLGNAAVVVLDNQACQVRAMVGSADYWAGEHGAVNGALARRQPGSSLKPFTYALAMEQEGLSPATALADIPTEYGDADGGLFRPQNFSKKFSGPVLLADALGRSLNVPAIRVAAEVGVEALLERLHELGFASLSESPGHYGLGLTLGNGEVTLLELAQGYAALARAGLACDARVLADASAAGSGDEERRVFSPEISFLITDILSDESLRIAAFGPANSLLLGFPIAVKTGTSSNWRDSWAIGYTERYTVAVWAGNFDGSSMNHLAGATGAGPLFHTIAKLVVERATRRGEPLPSAPRPPVASDRTGSRERVVAVEVCALSGHVPSEHCPHRRRMHVLASNRPSETCDWHQSIAVDRRNQLRAGPLCPDEFTDERVFASMPPEYAEWHADSGLEVPPVGYSPTCPADGPIPGSVVITYPRAGETFLIEPGFARATQSLRLAARADGQVAAVTWSVDGRRVARSEWPYTALWHLQPGEHEVSVSAPGQRGHRVRFAVR